MTVPVGTKDAYIAAGWTEKVFKGGIIESSNGSSPNANITFADANVKALCVANWDTDGDGELSKTEAAAVTDLGTVFKDNQSITSFNELQYFTGLTSIGSYAFYECFSLTSVTIPNSVTSIGEEAFRLCGFETMSIPEGVTTIGESAFIYCDNLETVYIPSTVTSIGRYAFLLDDDPLGAVYSFIEQPFAISSDVFEYEHGNDNYDFTDADLYVPKGTKALYEATDGWKNFKPYIHEMNSDDAVTVTAKSYTREYGEANPTFGFEVTEGSITSGTPTITCSATETSPVGTYWIVISQGSVSNSDVTLVNGTLTITKAALTITADDKTKEEGEENPELTVTYSGFVNGEDETVLTTLPTVTTTATKDSPAGTYPITASGATSGNYDFTYENGTLTVTEKPAQTTVEVTDISQMDNVIYIEPMKARTGTQAVISFKMKNTAEIHSFQFDLYLPEGVTPVKSIKGRIQGSLSAGRLPEEDEHSLTFDEYDGGVIHFHCDSQYDDIFTGNDGEIATLQVNIAETMADDDYAIVMKDMKLSEVDIDYYYQTASISTRLAVSSYTLGDINDDGVVDVSDYSGVASHIHENTPAGFNLKAADVDESGKIDRSDYSGIANIIHYGSIHGSAGSRQMRGPRRANTDVSQMDNVIYIKPFTAPAGTQASISICMKNTAEIRSFQFDLCLPEGMTAVKSSKGRIQGSLSAGRLPEEDDHKLSFSEHEGGIVRFLCDSEYGDTFTGNDGEIATLQVNIAETMADGDYAIVMKGMKLSEVDIANYYVADDIETTVTIGETGTPILGDVNNDGSVTPADAIMILYRYFGVEQTGFNETAADVNGDNDITPADAIEALYKYFGAGSSARANRPTAVVDSRDPE